MADVEDIAAIIMFLIKEPDFKILSTGHEMITMNRSEERRVGKEGGSRWSPSH